MTVPHGPGTDEESDALHARARAFVSAFERDAPMPEPFDALACDLARFQAERVPGFARLCNARGIDLSGLSRAAEIPPVPTDAFKLTRVATFPEGAAAATFRSSGTTIGERGTHSMRDTTTYDAAAVAFGRRWLARDLQSLVPVFVLGPSSTEAPDSSLAHMCEAFAQAFGKPAERTFVLDGDILDLTMFDERVARALAEDEPVLVLATSFALVYMLDAVGDATFELPNGSRVMQTGGFKGKSREVPPAKLRAELSRIFAIPERAIVAEYGMSELSSQFYEQTLFADAPHGVYVEPPWARVASVDPETLVELPDGEVGLAKIVDLANVDSAVAVLAQDRVRRVDGGFELLGRAPGAPPRGCSIAIDELLARLSQTDCQIAHSDPFFTRDGESTS